MLCRTLLLMAILAWAGIDDLSAQKLPMPYSFDDADDKATVFFLSSNDVPAGAFLSIFGDDFGASGTVSLGGTPAPIVSWEQHRITVSVPAGAAGPVIVAPGSGPVSDPFPLTIRPGRIRWVDQSAPAGGNGSEGTPWRDLATASSNLVAGDFVIVKAGVYTGTGEAAMATSKSGAQGNSITWFAKPGDFVLIDGTTTTKQAIRIDGAWTNVVGFVARGGQYQSILLNGTYSRVVDCEAKEGNGTASSKGQGINVNADYSKALGNYVHDNYSHGFYAHANYLEIGYNYVANSGCCGSPESYGYGVQVFMNPGATFTGARVYRNLVTSSNRSGIIIGQYADRVDMHENLVTGNDERCVIVNYGATNARIRNNVCYRNDRHQAGFYEIDLYEGTGIEVFNNAIVGPYAINKRSAMTGAIAIDGNGYDGTTRWTWDGTNYGTLSAWRAARSVDAASQVADPEFRDPARSDFRPGPSSPLIDAGIDAQCSHSPLGLACEQGAFEVPAGANDPAPNNPTNLRRTDRG